MSNIDKVVIMINMDPHVIDLYFTSEYSQHRNCFISKVTRNFKTNCRLILSKE